MSERMRDGGKVLTDLFLESVARHPTHIAIDVPPAPGRAERQVISYEQLADMACWVRHRISPHLAGESTILVFLPRETPWLYAAQLGVMLAGAAHVSLDLSHLDAHTAHVLRNAGAVAVITDERSASRFTDRGLPILLVPGRTEISPAHAAPEAFRPSWLSSTSLAYVIYTSGTTGLQKGVLIEHRGVVNLIQGGVTRFGVGPTDRIAQGSSAAYDSSVEEIWLAFAAGATLVVLDDMTVRLGPDLVPWLNKERITILCPPPTLLRAMGCASPSSELPSLRLCYVGGEPLSEDLAERWGRGLWLENGYGPTECTVTVIRGRIIPGVPVTIGTPVPPHEAHILDEHMKPVARGEVGELCIAGPGLARGYLGMEDLTARSFPTLPGLGRVYRTGDLVAACEDGSLRCLGRTDTQVKVRGHRIELEAIEAVVARYPGVAEVVCVAEGFEPERRLVAHVVPRDRTSPPPFAELRRAARHQLPEHMVPAHFALLDRVPLTVGGKVDRRQLPLIGVPTSASALDESDPTPRGRLRAEFAAVLGIPVDSLRDDDDFFALGGNSLSAALLVSRLRGHRALEHATVRQIYEAPNVAELGKRLGDTGAPQKMQDAPTLAPEPRSGAVVGFTVAQVAFLMGMLVFFGGLAHLLGFLLLPWLLEGHSLATLLFTLPWIATAIALCTGCLTTWLAIAAKEVLIGRYEAGRAAAFGGFRLRHWVVTNLARLVPWSWLAGTELQSVVLRAFGARIGRRVHIHRSVDLFGGGWDLLEIGDDVTIGREVDLGLCELDSGELVIGPVRIASGASLETRSGTGSSVTIGANATLRPLSFVPSGTHVPESELWHGVPAASAGKPQEAPDLDGTARAWSSWKYTFVALTVRALVGPLLAMPLALLTWALLRWLHIDGEAVLHWLCRAGPFSEPVWVFALACAAIFSVPFGLLQRALLLRWTPRIPEGTHPRWSLLYLWLSVRTEQVERAGAWLSGTLLWPAWLRLSGMQVGKDVEVSTILDVLPEHVAIGRGSFLADGVYLGVPRLQRGRVTVLKTRLGERSFLGNHVVVEAGHRLPDDLLLGVCTIADPTKMAAGSSWFGLPPFHLPQREIIALDRSLTHEPGRLRYAHRLMWEALRVTLPVLPLLLWLCWFQLGAAVAREDGSSSLWTSTWALGGVGAALVSCVLIAKWLLLGRVKPGQHGLWSCWASRWDFHYVMWQRCARGVLQPFEGTLLLPLYLRAMGMRIGHRCVLGDGFAQVVDPDMITIEDGATVHALFQAHSFEDRVLKIDHVHLGARSTVGKGTVVLYGASIGPRTHVLPHSVVMKREALLSGRRYAGAPTAESSVFFPGPDAHHDDAVTLPDPSGTRDGALDLGRGLAVIGMICLHFVPAPNDITGIATWLLDTSLTWTEGIPAAMFLLLAGMTSTLSRRGDVAAVLRRSLALIVVGLPFWRYVWPNDILIPLALMLAATFVLRRAGRGVLAFVVALITLAIPFVTVWGSEDVWVDCLEDGTHLANHEWGFVTLRYFLFDGAYPLLPWCCLPLLGALMAKGTRDPGRMIRWFWLAAPLPTMALLTNFLSASGTRDLNGLETHLAITWQPTSVPFLLLHGGSAVACLAGLSWWVQRRGLPRLLSPFAALGRASLTHYLGHIVLVYAGMRLVWPAEDWSVGTGIMTACAYTAFALWFSSWWFARRHTGPIEALLRSLSNVGTRDNRPPPGGRDHAQ